MASLSTGLDAQNTFLSALQGMGSGAIAGGKAMMDAASATGAAQQQASVYQSMQAAQAQTDAVHASGMDEVEQRKSIMQYQQKALMQVAANGGNKEQMAAIQNLLPPIPQSAHEAMLTGQMTGDSSMYQAGKKLVDMDQANKIQVVDLEAKNARILESQKMDDAAAKSVKEQAFKTIGVNQGSQEMRNNLGDNLNQGFEALGFSYDPTTKTMLNKNTKETFRVNNYDDIAAHVGKMTGATGSGASTGMYGTLKTWAAPFGGNNSSIAQKNLYNSIAQLKIESQAKLVGTRMMSTETGRNFMLTDKPEVGDSLPIQLRKLAKIADDTHNDNKYVSAQNARLTSAIKSNSKNMADWNLEPTQLDYNVQDTQKAPPAGGVPVTTGRSPIPGVNFNPRSN